LDIGKGAIIHSTTDPAPLATIIRAKKDRKMPLKMSAGAHVAVLSTMVL
jgi:hypothetical protein